MLRSWLASRKERKLEPVVRKALDLFHSRPGLNDWEMVRFFTGEGIKRSMAHRVLLYVPIAYCRALYEPKGVKFSRHIQFNDMDSDQSVGKQISEEPVFGIAQRLVAEIIQTKSEEEVVEQIASKSAEYDAIQHLQSRGSDPSDIVLEPLVVLDDGSYDDAPLYRELDLIAEFLCAIGQPAVRSGERVELAFAEDVKARLNFTEYDDGDSHGASVVAELEVFVLPEPVTGICFRAMGRGRNRREALRDYVEVFTYCLIPPLQTALCPGAAEGVRCKHFQVGKQRWRALRGPALLYTIEDADRADALSELTYGPVLWNLLEPALMERLDGAPRYTTWVLLYATNVREKPVVEARYFNDVWPEGSQALEKVPWPRTDEFAAFRELWLIEPELDTSDN